MLPGFSSSGCPLHRGSALSSSLPYPLIDIGLNILDDMFKGHYNSKQRHRDDTFEMLTRSKSIGMKAAICTAGSEEESLQTISFCRKLCIHENKHLLPNLYCTVGVHPTRCSGLDDALGDRLSSIISDGLSSGFVKAIGECGLDYDRLHFCDKESQIKGFKMQLELGKRFPQLPFFLHNRNTDGDFLRVMQEYKDVINRNGGVVHSFTGKAKNKCHSHY